MSEAAALTPNDHYRRIRRLYLGAVTGAIALLFLALVATVNKVGFGVLPALMLVTGVGLLVMAMLLRGAARCPACSASLMWKSGPFGTGRLSIGVKPRCPSCGLDLEKPWTPPPEPSEPDTERQNT
jgi:hypothetical protein